MTEHFESESFVLPSEVKSDVASRLKEKKGIRGLELHMKGDGLEGSKKFSELLVALHKRGVKISHDITVRLEFPQSISRERMLDIVDTMPKPKNGSVRVRVRLDIKGDAVQPKPGVN